MLKKGILACLFLAALGLFGILRALPEIVTAISRQKLARSFPGARTHLEKASLALTGFELDDISVEYDSFSMRAPKILAPWTLRPVPGITEIIGEGVQIVLGPHFTVPSLPTGVSSNKIFPIQRMQLEHLSVQIRLEDMTVDLEGSLAFNPANQKILSANLTLPRFQWKEFHIENTRLTLNENTGKGKISIRRASFGKISLEKIRGDVQNLPEAFVIDPLTVTAWDAPLSGSFRLPLTAPYAYAGSLTIQHLPVASVLRTLEMDTKARLSGLFSGHLRIAGNRSGLSDLNGLLNADPPGGDLDVTDPQIFSDLASRTNQPVTLIEAGLSRYHFDSGRISASRQDHALQVELYLEGPSGKRQLEPTLHDFFKKENG